MRHALELEESPLQLVGNLSVLAGNLEEGVALCHDGVISWASPRLAAILGRRDSEALIGRSMETLLEDVGSGIPAAGSDAAVCCRVQGLAGDERRVRVCRIEAPAGDRAEVWLVLDISRQNTLEQEVLRLSQQLHRANKEVAQLSERLRRDSAEREELLTVVSHELRTPVTIIAGYNKLLLSDRVGRLSDEQRHFLDESVKSCQRLNEFIDNLMESSRDGQGPDTLSMTVGSLAQVVHGVVTFLRPLFEEHELQVELDLDPAASEACFDAPRIEQVLTNLLSNAIKYAKSGGSVGVSTSRVAAAGREFVEVAVVDNGPGIAFADQARIFEPYVRANGESEAGGLGLGLAICKRIVDGHGGIIVAANRKSGGSRFSFTLPAAGDGVAAATEKPEL